ncbi:3981_t:CDS:2, partial [Dentiscutata heterogama]
MSIIARKISYTVEYSSTSRPSKSQQIASLPFLTKSLLFALKDVSSVNPTAWAISNEMMDRVDRNEERGI